MSTKQRTVLAALAMVGLLAACGGSSSEADEASSLDPVERPTTTTAAPRPRPRPTTTTTAASTPPTVTDFAISLITTDSQCFGSAGCNVTVVPELSIVGPAALDWNEELLITYQVDGDESGPIIETVELSPDGSYGQRETRMSTTSAGVVPTATITMVR